MADVSSNDNFINDDEFIDEELSDVSSNDNEAFQPNYQGDEDYLAYVQSEIRADSSIDYSSHFENIENLFKFQIAVIIGLVLCICFIVGWKHD